MLVTVWNPNDKLNLWRLYRLRTLSMCSGEASWSNVTSGQELHDEVEVHLVLEAVEHLHHPQAVRLHQDVPLSPDVTHLKQSVKQAQLRAKPSSV